MSDLLTGSLIEIRVARAGDVVSPDIMAVCLTLFNGYLDQLNAQKRAVYNEPFSDFTFTPNLNPHTIGPSGTFNTGTSTTRPQEILAAAVNLGGTTSTFKTINVQNRQWYDKQITPGSLQAFPTDVYYDPAWPLGKLYFVGVPTVAYGCRLWLRVLLAQVALTDTVTLPPGHQEALRLSMAEILAPSFGQSVDPNTEKRAREARALIWDSNTRILDQQTRDGGMPGARPSGFNFYNGEVIS